MSFTKHLQERLAGFEFLTAFLKPFIETIILFVYDKFPIFSHQKWISFSTIIYCNYYRYSDGILMSLIIRFLREI